MGYILGAGMLFAAILVLASGRLALRRFSPRPQPDAFGAAEALAFVFTVLLSFGVTVLGAEVLGDGTLLGVAQLIAAVAAAGAAGTAAWIGLDRRVRRREADASGALQADPPAPDGGRRGRPAGPGTPGRSAARAKRAA